MKTLTTLTAALALGLALPAAAEMQNPGRGGGDHARGHDDRGGGRGGDERAGRRQDGDRGRDRAREERRGDDRGAERVRDDRREAARQVERRAERAREARRDQARDADRRFDRLREERREEARRLERRFDGAIEARRDRDRDEVRWIQSERDRDRDDLPRLLFRPDRGLIAGCPPGLAKRDNGCLPPGQARKLVRDEREWWWRSGDAYRYRFDDGYMYRLSPRGDLLGWLPALGGVLAVGQPWPTQYTAWEPAPAYYTGYYRLDDRYRYRYADGALYGVDPETQAIGQIAALLTGQPWTVGQPMPAGYDVYNLPYDYRGRYVDSPDSWYRYSDGYVYQVDPTTRLVMAAIQLLA